MKRRQLLPLALSLILVVGAWLIVGRPPIRPQAQRLPVGLSELTSIDQLRTRFQADAGQVRLILLLSSTCPVCQAGARWVEDTLLRPHPAARVRVYALWVAKLSGDGPGAWDGGGLTDPRVVHLWDGQDRAGGWFRAHLPGDQASDWDAYLLFGPDATWGVAPGPLLSAGTTIIGTKDALARGIAPWLSAGTPTEIPSGQST